MENLPLKLIWSRPARGDLIDIWLYVAESGSTQAADAILRSIAEACGRLTSYPQMGRPRDSLERGLRSILVAPYVVFYRVGDDVEIYRVVHGRRDLEAIFKRDRPRG